MEKERVLNEWKLEKKRENQESGEYEDNDFIYGENGTVTSKSTGESISLSGWENKELGIELVDSDDIEVSITESNSASEGDTAGQSMSFTVSLSRELENGETLDVNVSNSKEGTVHFSEGVTTQTVTMEWSGDTTDSRRSIVLERTLTPTIVNYDGSDDVKVTVKNSGKAIVYEDDDKRYDPLALDTNKDGFISTTSLEESNSYFDITGDGLREHVGWIKAEDALLTYDKNDNGQIDGIDEVFGNLSESGFNELKRLIDSNHDNKIDRRDELFCRLQTWNDLNQDGKVQLEEAA